MKLNEEYNEHDIILENGETYNLLSYMKDGKLIKLNHNGYYVTVPIFL